MDDRTQDKLTALQPHRFGANPGLRQRSQLRLVDPPPLFLIFRAGPWNHATVSLVVNTRALANARYGMKRGRTRSFVYRIAIALMLTVVMATTASAQSTTDDVLMFQAKNARLAEAGAPAPRIRMLVRPSEQTPTHPRFGYSLIVGARYDPSVFPSESWIYIGCISQDPRVKWDTSQFGFSLVRVHALIYELNDDGSLNSNTMISTVDTEASDEAICDLSQGVDTSFIEIPRTFNAAVVSLLSIGSSTQYIEVTESIERALPQ